MSDAIQAPSAQDAANRYELLPGRVRVESERGVRELPLDDAAAPTFLALPVLDLTDGRPLRRAAFDAWSDHVRADVAKGREFEAAYRAPRPYATWLAIGGAACVLLLSTSLLLRWLTQPVPAVDVRASALESLAAGVAVLLVVTVVVLAVVGLVRAWRCRRGSYLHLSSYGLRTVHGGRAEPLANVASADWHGLLRCTRIAFADGRPDLWLPAEPGPLARADLLLAALDDRLGASLRSGL